MTRPSAGPTPARRFHFDRLTPFAAARRTIRAALSDEGYELLTLPRPYSVVAGGELVVYVPDAAIVRRDDGQP